MSRIARSAREGARKNFKTITASTTLTQADSGKTILLNATAATTVTLPELSTLKEGTFYRFVVIAANDNKTSIVTGDRTDTTGDMYVGGFVLGQVQAALENPSSAFIGFVAPAGDDSSIDLDGDLADSGGEVGTWFELLKTSNSNWMCSGFILSDDADGTGAALFTN
jgi:hypothetical protein